MDVEISAAITDTAVNLLSGLHCFNSLIIIFAIKRRFGSERQSAAIIVPFQIADPSTICNQISINMSVP